MSAPSPPRAGRPLSEQHQGLLQGDPDAPGERNADRGPGEQGPKVEAAAAEGGRHGLDPALQLGLQRRHLPSLMNHFLSNGLISRLAMKPATSSPAST